MDGTSPANVSAEALRAFAALGVAEAVGWTTAEVRAWRAVGRQRLAAGCYEAACDILAYACFLDAGDAGTWEALAVARLAAGRPEAARPALEAALALEPTWRRAALAARCSAALGEAP
jgi:Flp pilus assembly protein TadD